MKRLKKPYAGLLVGILLLIFSPLSPADAQDNSSAEADIYKEAKGQNAHPGSLKRGRRLQGKDSIEVSLLTCAQSSEIYGLYGHTALRWHNLRTGEDWAFNYGIFNFNKPLFALRFTMGITDYELGVTTYDVFRRAYKRRGVRVVEQVLDLTDQEKEVLFRELSINYLPENRVYRYNCYYDNCTTRARDKVEECVGGKIVYPDSVYEKATFRTLIHESNAGHPWAAFGVDLCMGLGSDLGIDRRTQEFLPRVLMDDFAGATIEGPDGSRLLVRETHLAVDAPAQDADKEFPLSPMGCAIVLLALSIVIGILELKTKRVVLAYDFILMVAQSLAGIIIVVLFFSQHPTTSTNLQILVLNPMPLFFLPSVMREGQLRKDGRRRPLSAYWKVSATLTMLFLLGALIQDYAEGMEVVALCLLTRCYIHYKLKVRR